MDRTTADPLEGQLLDGRYLVGPRIARGGMATVYEGTDLRLDRRVALKVVPESLSHDEVFAQRFVREARAAARLTHPNVVAVYDQGDDRGTLFLAMEFVPGRHTLRDVVRDEAPLPPTRALSILEEVLKAIAAAHEAGIVHRDVKPENVLIDPRGQIKVADFGLARAISSATSATATGGVLMGTVSYLPPELVVDGSADARSDVYALGVLLFEMLTGVKPHTGDSPIQVAYKHVHEDIPAPSTVVGGIPPYIDAFVARATSRQADLRPADGHVMLQQLRRVRHALDDGVLDDHELTEDLTPTVPVGAGGPRPAPVPPPIGVAPSADDVFDVAAYDDFRDAPPHSERTLVVGETRPEPAPAPPAAPPRQPVPSTAPRPPAKRGRRGWVAFLVVLLLAVGAAAAGWWYGVGRFESTPNVVNMDQAAAKDKIEAAGLEFKISDTAYSETVDAGDVISTDPGPGDDVLKDGTVTAVVSRGPERHAVPDVEGLSLDDATARITGSSLTVGDVRREYNDDVAKGHVISFSPKVGTELRRDDEVSLLVSRGPVPIDVVDYTGQAADDAESALSDAGFDVNRVERYNDDVAAGVVVRQTPHRGTGFAGDTIKLVVSLGPHLVEVPDVMAAGTADATDELEAAGFNVDVEHSSLYVGLEYVVDQSPNGGEMAPFGSTVVITIV